MTSTTITRVPTISARIDGHPWAVPSPGELRDVTLGDALGDTDVVESLLNTAAQAARELPGSLDDALVDFADRPPRSGALLITGLAVGDLPPTPPAPDAPLTKDLTTELTLLTVARRLGQPVGYAPEHGGAIVQNIVPTERDAQRQMSTSSRSNLMFHTETAFHPYRPRYLALMCLRGDPAARTTLASVFDVVDALPGQVVDEMFEPRFRTSVDASFLGGRRNSLGAPHPLIAGTRDEPTFVFDADLTVGVDEAAQSVVTQVATAIATCEQAVTLAPGELLLIDNNVAVHGRSPFPARFDGTDRWLQRAFVVADLAPSARDRVGRVITTQFGEN